MSLSEGSSSSNKVMKETGTYFTDDVWFQIFPHFSWKLISKLKCISKVWNSHLSSPEFKVPWMLIYTFRQRSLKKFSIAHPGDSPSQLISKFSFEFLPNSSSSDSELYSTIVLGSSNGLVLCDRNSTHIVCNPVTEKWVQLPPTLHQLDTERFETTLIGFECDCSSLLTRFKVLHIPKWQERANKFNIDVFSSELDGWNSFEVFFPNGENRRFPGFGDYVYPRSWDELPIHAIVIHKNVLYWMAWYGEVLVYNLDEMNPECRFIELPERGICIDSCLGVSSGSVFYARIKKSEDNHEIMCVWEVQEGNFHLLLDNIDLRDLFAEMGAKLSGTRWSDRIHLIGFNPEDSNVFIIGCRNYIWAYNIQTRMYEELSHPSSPGNEHSDDDFVYLPILFKPMPTALPHKYHQFL